MRMWNVEPAVMCRKHLLGEHLEMHMFVGAIQKGKSMEGFIRNGLVEVDHIIDRHLELAREIHKRGYKHNSPMPFVVINQFWLRFNDPGFVDPQRSLEELAWRCPECQVRIKEFYSGE